MWFGAAIYFNSALLLMATPVFTRLLSPAEYGEVTLFTTWTTIISLFSTLSLSKGILQTALLDFEKEQAKYVSSILGLIGGLTLITGGAIFLATRVSGMDTGLRPSLLAYSVVHTLFLTTVQIWLSIERFYYRYKAAVAINIAIAISGAPLAAACLLILQQKEYAVEYRAIGGTASMTIAGVWLYLRLLKKGGAAYDKKYWRYALIHALPLFPHYIAQTLVQQFDRISMERQFSHATLGVYGLAATVASGITLFWTAINTTYTPWLLRQLKAGDANLIQTRTREISLAVTIAACLFSLLSPEVVSIIAPPSYSAAASAASLLIAASALQFLASLYLTAEFSAKRARIITLTSVGAAIVTAICLFVLMPLVGWLMAALTQIGSQVFQLFIFRKLRSRRGDPELLDNNTMWSAIALLSICTLAAMAVGPIERILLTLILLGQTCWKYRAGIKRQWLIRTGKALS